MHTSAAPIEIKQRFYSGGEHEHSWMNSEYYELFANQRHPAEQDSRKSLTTQNWTLLEIHDWPRFGQYEFDSDQGRMREKLGSALGYLLTAEGTPVLYYGVEQGLSGNCPYADRIALSGHAKSEVQSVCNGWDHERYRQDMWTTGPWKLGSLVPEVNKLAYISGFSSTTPHQDWRTDPYLRTDLAHYKWVRRLVAIRKSCGALRHGNTYFRAAESYNGGILAFSRIDWTSGKELLVIVNTGDFDKHVQSLHIDGSIHQAMDFQQYKNLLNGYETASIGNKGYGKGLYFNGGHGVTIPAHSIKIYAHENNVAPYNADLGAHLCRQ
jgi:glycosidase